MELKVNRVSVRTAVDWTSILDRGQFSSSVIDTTRPASKAFTLPRISVRSRAEIRGKRDRSRLFERLMEANVSHDVSLD